MCYFSCRLKADRPRPESVSTQLRRYRSRSIPPYREFHSFPSGTSARQRLSLELASNAAERAACAGTDRSDRAQADNDDQSQHNRILNSGWAVFRLQKTIDLRGEVLHGISPNAKQPGNRAYKKLNVTHRTQASPPPRVRLASRRCIRGWPRRDTCPACT